MRGIFLTFLIAAVVVFVFAAWLRVGGKKTPQVGKSQSKPGWPSSVSVSCLQQGGRLEARDGIFGGDYRICKFEDGRRGL